MSSNDSDSSGPSPSAAAGHVATCDIAIQATVATHAVAIQAAFCDLFFDEAHDKWEVVDILAERTVRGGGDSECLVVWKPTWTPLSKVQEGHVLSAWKTNTKFIPNPAHGQYVKLPFDVLTERELRISSQHQATAAKGEAHTTDAFSSECAPQSSSRQITHKKRSRK
jgi:hypothetical protein